MNDDSSIDDPAAAKLQPTRQRSLANRHRFLFIRNGEEAVVAIFKRPMNGVLTLVGTGFFISRRAIATADHLFKGEDVADDDEFEVMQKRGDGVAIRQIEQTFSGEPFDVAICVVSPPTVGFEDWDDHPVVGTMRLDPEPKEPVGSFMVSHTLVGSPRMEAIENDEALVQPVKFRTHWELGHMEEVHAGGLPNLPGRCFQTSVFVEGRGSGGPLFNSNGSVVGLNNRSDSHYEGLPYSFALSIRHVLDLRLGGESVSEVRHREGGYNRIAKLIAHRQGAQ